MTTPTYETYIGLDNVWTPVSLQLGSGTSNPPVPPPLTNGIFTPLAIDGGGYITGVSSGQELYCRADVGGIYWWDAANSRWVQRLTGTGVALGIRASYHVESLAQAPSNGSIVYAAVGAGIGRIYRSADKGLNWTATAATFTIEGNDQPNAREGTERIAVHPTNPNIVLLGLKYAQGLRMSTDGGVTFPLLASQPPTATGAFSQLGCTCVGFDPTDPTRYYVTVPGVGLCLWNGTTWSTVYAFANGFNPAMAISPTGTVWTSFKAGAEPWQNPLIRRTKLGVVTQIDAGPSTIWRAWYGIAIDPANESRVIIMWSDLNALGGTQQIERTTNGTAATPTWVDMSPIALDDGVAGTGWINDFPDQYTGNCKFGPDGALWIGTGWGMFRCTDLNDTQATIVFTSKGIEERVSKMAIKPLGQPLLTIGWDLGIFRHPVGALPTRPHPYKLFGSGWNLALCPTNNNFAVASLSPHPGASFNPNANQSGYSTDAGATWTRFASYTNGTHPTGLGFGHMAVSANNVDNIVWAPGNFPTNNMYYTTNRGVNWIPSNVPAGYIIAAEHYQSRYTVQPHPTVAGTFYAIAYKNDVSGVDTLLRSTDGGVNWSVVSTSGLESYNFRYGAKLKINATHMYALPGHADAGDRAFYRCSLSNVGVWTKLTSMFNAHDIGIGAPLTGNTNQTLYTWGRPTVNSQDGLYCSVDDGATWTFISQYVNGLYDYVACMEADREVPGRFWVGMTGNGYTEINIPANFVTGGGGPPPPSSVTKYDFNDNTLQGWTAQNGQTISVSTTSPLEGTHTARAVATVTGNQMVRRLAVPVPSDMTNCAIAFKYRQSVNRDVQMNIGLIPGYHYRDGGYDTQFGANTLINHSGSFSVTANTYTSMDVEIVQYASAIGEIFEFDEVTFTWT